MARQGGQRPEASGSAPQLYAADSERYTSQNAQIQGDMATLAVQLLALQGPPPALLADIGCGSALSSAALVAAKAAWIGLDVSPDMLRLAQAQPGARGRLVLSDFAQGLPLRAASLDGAVSVSAVQWLCSSDSGSGSGGGSAAPPPPGMLRFFGTLLQGLKPGGVAALQVYPEGDAQAQQLVAGARRCGLSAGFFVAFPHSTPAKKYFLIAQRPQAAPPEGADQQQRQQQGEHLSAHCCNLAWPKIGSCLLAWERRLQQQGAVTAALSTAVERMHREHGAMGKRLLRLLRRAEAESSTAAAPGGGGGGSSEAWTLQAELQVTQPALQPCGGTLFVQLTAAPGVLCPADDPTAPAPVGLDGRRHWPAPAADGSADAGPEWSAEVQHSLSSAATAVVQRLLGSSAAVQQVALKAAKQEEVALHARLQPLQRFEAPPAGSTAKVHRFMRLEPLAPPAQQVQQAQQPAQPVAAVLHAQKMAPHLALRFSHNSPGSCTLCAAAGTDGGTCGSAACTSHAAAGVRAFCAAEEACVLSVDAHLHADGRLDATWTLFVRGLQERGRPGLLATLRRHFA